MFFLLVHIHDLSSIFFGGPEQFPKKSVTRQKKNTNSRNMWLKHVIEAHD